MDLSNLRTSYTTEFSSNSIDKTTTIEPTIAQEKIQKVSQENKNTSSLSFNTTENNSTPTTNFSHLSTPVTEMKQSTTSKRSTNNTINANTKSILNNNQNSIFQTNSLTPRLLEKNIKKSESTLNNTNSNIFKLLAIKQLSPEPFSIETRPTKEIETPTYISAESSAENVRFYLTAGVGSIRNLSSTYSGNTEISTKLIDRERSLWGVNTTLHFGMQTKNKLNIFGGFDYAHLVSQYYNGETEVEMGTTSATFESIDETYALVTTEGHLTTTTSIDKDLRWHRHHNMLNFQLGVSKDLTTKSQFIFAPEVSLLQNIFSSHKGYYFSDEAPNFVKFERGEESPYRKNTGLKTQLGLNLGYKTSKWQFTVNTAWRNPLSNLTTELNNYQIKNSQLSQLGKKLI